MLYRHTPRFQFILQTALREAAGVRGYSDGQMTRDARLTCGKSTLNRFLRSPLVADFKNMGADQADQILIRSTGSVLNSRDASLLWDHLSGLGLIDKAMQRQQIRKQSLYSLREVANAISCFYAADSTSSTELLKSSVSGRLFCYKPSFRKPGFIVKSLMTITPEQDDYLHVKEIQRTSARYEADRIPVVEQSKGFGLIKSERVWLFLRDMDSDQPRIFCFKPKLGRPSGAKSLEQMERETSRIGSWLGFLIEGATGNRNDAFGFNAALIREDAEQELWEAEGVGGRLEKAEDQIDVYPASDEQRRRYKEQLREHSAFIPEHIIDYVGIGFAGVPVDLITSS